MHNQLVLFEFAPSEPIFTEREYNEIMRWRAQRLVEAGEMPSIEEVEVAVRIAREKVAKRRAQP